MLFNLQRGAYVAQRPNGEVISAAKLSLRYYQ